MLKGNPTPFTRLIFLLFFILLGCTSLPKKTKSDSELLKNNLAALAVQLDSTKSLNKELINKYANLEKSCKEEKEKLTQEVNWDRMSTGNPVSSNGKNTDTKSQSQNNTVAYRTKIKYITTTVEAEKKVVTQFVYPQNVASRIAFFCEQEMKEGQTYEVRALVNLALKDKEIRIQLLDLVNESRKENREPLFTLDDIISKKVNLGYYLKIELKDNADKFKIGAVNPDTQKTFDEATNQFSKQAFEWMWNVTPKAGSKANHVTLNLVITPMDKNKIAQKEIVRTYKINIHLKQSFVSALWEEMNRNVQWAIASIITPILTFLAGRYLKKKETNTQFNFKR